MPDKPVTILLVEDNELDVFMFQRLMRRLRLDNPLLQAANGEEALKILKPDNSKPLITPPFIVLLDINMPRMNGFELLESLNSDPVLFNIPVYVLTTSTFVSDKKRAVEYNITGYLTKPIQAEQILRILKVYSDTG